MIIRVNFDYHGQFVYIPDGYTLNINDLQIGFLEWVKTQPECIRIIHGRLGYSYDENDFLNYINKIILNSSKEKAYFLKSINSKKKIKTISF